MGQNGAGKSTLEQCTGGESSIRGNEVAPVTFNGKDLLDYES